MIQNIKIHLFVCTTNFAEFRNRLSISYSMVQNSKYSITQQTEETETENHLTFDCDSFICCDEQRAAVDLSVGKMPG